MMEQGAVGRGRKKALLVGINRYGFAKGDADDLTGCINDVNLMRVVLEARGYQILGPLINGRAKKASILAGLRKLLRDPKPGSHLVFYFAGHGSEVVVGNEHFEIICPSDVKKDGSWTSKFITDLELVEKFRSLPRETSLEVILDSCHSSGMANPGQRPPRSSRTSRRSRGRRLRFMRPPEVLRGDARAAALQPRGFRALGDQERLNCPCVYWGAADAEAGEDEFDGKPHGIFTYLLCQALKDAPRDLTREALFYKLAGKIRRREQENQLLRNNAESDTQQVLESIAGEELPSGRKASVRVKPVFRR